MEIVNTFGTVTIRKSDGCFSVYDGENIIYAGLTRNDAFWAAMTWINA